MFKVMLVDDEPFIRQGMKIILDWTSYGYEIAAEAENGIEALEILKTQEIDVVFADLKMPEMSGLEMIEQARAMVGNRVHFVILTGYAEFAYAKEALRLSVDDYLLKPIQEEEVVRILKRLHSVLTEEKENRSGAEEIQRQELDAWLARIVLNKYLETELQRFKPSVDMRERNIDELTEAVRRNDKGQIAEKTRKVYEQIQRSGSGMNVIHTKIHYLLYRLVELANELDSEANQEEILQYIAQESFDEIVLDGTEDELLNFVCAYAEYLEQLRKLEANGLFGQVELYVRENYDKNISLKSIGEQFYVNNVYLGQLFKKKSGVSFKEYLNRIRLEKAAKLLETTDEKIYTIAKKVGFQNTDYFISKFVRNMGMTPGQYRGISRRGRK